MTIRRVGLTAVLHTWGSALTHHPHVHMIVPGGGLAAAVADRLRPWIGSAVAAALLVAFRFVPTRTGLGGTACAAALWLLGVTLTGHAVMDEGWLGAIHRGNDALHVLTAGAWFGALVPVLLILPCLAQAEHRSSAVLARRRFSRAGHVAVALVLLTGAANAALVLGRWPTDLASPYEAPLDLKVLAVLAMAGLAVANRYVLVRRLPSSLSALRRATLAELPLGLAAIALVASTCSRPKLAVHS